MLILVRQKSKRTDDVGMVPRESSQNGEGRERTVEVSIWNLLVRCVGFRQVQTNHVLQNAKGRESSRAYQGNLALCCCFWTLRDVDLGEIINGLGTWDEKIVRTILETRHLPMKYLFGAPPFNMPMAIPWL